MKFETIHKDERGFISTLTGEEFKTIPELSIMFTKEGIARGGCYHEKSTEHLAVIEGKILYIYRLPGEEESRVYLSKGQGITIPPKTPHYMISITDSIIAEWGPEVEEKQNKHEEFRKIVLDHNLDVLTPNRNIVFPPSNERKYC